MNDKRLTKLYKSHNEPQSSHYLVVHEDAHLSYKRYKIKKFYFNGHPKVHMYQYTQTHTVFVFIFFFFIKGEKKNKTKQNKQNKQSSILKSNKTRLTQNNKCTTEMLDK